MIEYVPVGHVIQVYYWSFFTLWVVWESIANFWQPQAERGSSVRTGTVAPTQKTKNVYQRLWWDLIYPNQLMGLYQRSHQGASSSSDSKWIGVWQRFDVWFLQWPPRPQVKQCLTKVWRLISSVTPTSTSEGVLDEGLTFDFFTHNRGELFQKFAS